MRLRLVAKVFMNFLTHPVKMVTTLRQLNIWIREDEINPKAPDIKDKALWAKKCRGVTLTTIRRSDFSETFEAVEAFYNDLITCLKEFSTDLPDDEVILLIAVKNDCSRIAHLLNHYRSIGIKHFVFIDNGSNDGTVEKVLQQEDTACYLVKARFNSFRKAGWFNRIAAHYGTNRLYIVIDSDELFVYPEMTRLPIGQYVKIIQNKQISCVKTVMLDMYPNGTLMDETMSDEEYLARCTYFDRGDRSGHPGEYVVSDRSVSGGMRARVFGEKDGLLLTKPTLLHYSKAFLLSPHHFYPDSENNKALHGGALLHYKFLPSDKERYRQRVCEGNYYRRSAMYKTITAKLERTPDINAMCDISVEFDAASAWQYLPFIKNLTEM